MIEEKFAEVEKYLPKFRAGSRLDTSLNYMLSDLKSMEKDDVDDLINHDFSGNPTANEIILMMRTPPPRGSFLSDGYDLVEYVLALKKYWEIRDGVQVEYMYAQSEADPFISKHSLNVDGNCLTVDVDKDGFGNLKFRFDDKPFLRELVHGYVNLLRSQHTLEDIALKDEGPKIMFGGLEDYLLTKRGSVTEGKFVLRHTGNKIKIYGVSFRSFADNEKVQSISSGQAFHKYIATYFGFPQEEIIGGAEYDLGQGNLLILGESTEFGSIPSRVANQVVELLAEHIRDKYKLEVNMVRSRVVDFKGNKERVLRWNKLGYF
jgi:hypothetical protein